MCYFALLAHDYCKIVQFESNGKSTHCTSIENIYLQLCFINTFLFIGHFSVATLREMNYLCVKMREIVRLPMLIESNALHADMHLVLGKFHTISKSYFPSIYKNHSLYCCLFILLSSSTNTKQGCLFSISKPKYVILVLNH